MKQRQFDTPHTDESGPSREVVIAMCLAGPDSGKTVMHLTPREEREYNDGMARLAENHINAFTASVCTVISVACLIVTASQGNGIFAALFLMMLLQSARDLCNEYDQ